jgi:cytidylate kinase
MMKESYESHLESMIREVDGSPYKGQTSTRSLVAPELKIRHKKSGLMYVVDTVGLDSVILRTPEDKVFQVSQQEIESDYELN